MGHIPDEIISEILSPALTVHDHMLSDTSGKSPFASNSASGSSTLLVCKSWLRVATPFLYSVVIIRTKPQAQALQMTLQSNPDLGRFVKKLRVEAGFGRFMLQILKNTPNVNDIALSLLLPASDPPSGLVRGLPLINPTRLIIIDDNDLFRTNKAVSQLTTALETCVGKWTNLNKVLFPYDQWMYERYSFLRALCACPTVKTVSFPLEEFSSLNYLAKIVGNASLDAIEIRPKAITDRMHSLSSRMYSQSSVNPRLAELLCWVDNPINSCIPATESLPCLPTDPSFRPLVSVPKQTVDCIWARILFFAMLSEHPTIGRYLWELDVRLYDERDDLLATAITRSSLEISVLSSIVPLACNLTHLIAGGSQCIPWEVFATLAKTCGRTLQEFTGFRVTIGRSDAAQSPSVFNHFTVLRAFTWSTSGMALPALEFLSIKTDDALSMFSQMNLQSLRHAVITSAMNWDPTFLRTHGSKIRHLEVHKGRVGKDSVFMLCPNMVTLTCSMNGDGEDLGCGSVNDGFQHPFLHKIILTDFIIGAQKTYHKEWAAFFLALGGSHHLPELREICIRTLEWPTSE
ncbi:hypothetical protein DFH09DRAFT_1491282 [Mycena vulgaris]|nr:hypothetical protein DFH09DRAFT_1491282 [Mycena vulgaris]